MATLTKKQLWKENDEWVVVGLKQNKSVEKGWVLVPDKSKGKPVDEPDRVDKILARYAERETDVRPSPLVEALFQSQNTQNAALPRPRRHGVCKRSESQGVPQARSRHLRGRRRDPAGTESRRQVRSRSQRSDRSAPSLGHRGRFPRGGCFFVFCFFRRSGSRRRHPLTPRPPVSARRLYDGVHVDDKPIPVSHVADKENVDREQEA